MHVPMLQVTLYPWWSRHSQNFKQLFYDYEEVPEEARNVLQKYYESRCVVRKGCRTCGVMVDDDRFAVHSLVGAPRRVTVHHCPADDGAYPLTACVLSVSACE